MGRQRKRHKPAKAAKEIPSPDTVVAEFEVRPPGGEPHRVLRTNQVDEYEEPAGAPRKDKKKKRSTGSPPTPTPRPKRRRKKR